MAVFALLNLKVALLLQPKSTTAKHNTLHINLHLNFHHVESFTNKFLELELFVFVMSSFNVRCAISGEDKNF